MNTTPATPPKPSDEVTLTIDGMSCGHCVRSVKAALDSVVGVAVKSVGVGTAVIEASDAAAADRAIAALEAAGYPARAADLPA